MLNEPTIAVILVLIAVMSVAALICYREMVNNKNERHRCIVGCK